MDYEQKQRRLRYLSSGLIVLLVVALLANIAFEIYSNLGNMKAIYCFQCGYQAVFLAVASGTLIHMYRLLTEYFRRSNYHQSQITQMQKYLLVFIITYGVMAGVNLMLLLLEAIYTLTYATIVLDVVNGFILDFFTIGVTLNLNLQASSLHKQR